MKIKVLLVILGISLIALPLCGQKLTSYREWKMDESKSLIWQEVIIDSTLTVNDVIRHIKSVCREVDEKDGVIHAKVIDYMIDYKKYPRPNDLPYIYKFAKWDWSVTVETKPGKYRVTLNNITFEGGSVQGGFYDIPINGTYDEVVLKKDRSMFKPGQLEYLNVFGQELKSLFTVKKITQSNEW